MKVIHLNVIVIINIQTQSLKFLAALFVNKEEKEKDMQCRFNVQQNGG